MTLNSTSTIVVTGASSGIGRATALDLARSEHHVYAAARRERELRTLADTHRGISALPLDVTDPDSVAAAQDRVHLETGGRGPDVLVNAAGVAALGPVEATPVDQVRRQFEVNVTGTKAEYQQLFSAGPGLSAKVTRASIPAENVAKTIARAATAPRPRARYVPGARNSFNIKLLTNAPTRAVDRIKSRLMELDTNAVAEQ